MATLSDDVVEALSHIETEANRLVITEQLDRKLYGQVDKVLQALGAKWNRSAKAHLFPEGTSAYDKIDELLLIGEVPSAVTDKKTYDVFYTPAAIAKLVVDAARIEPGNFVLEPSCGGGALAIPALRAAEGVEVHAWDIRDVEDELGQATGLRFEQLDLLDLTPAPDYDRVVMNPPFSKQRDTQHVRHAFSFLRPGGRLVAITSPSWQYRSNTAAREFREFFEANNGVVIDLPEGAFKESGTGVRSVLLTLDKT
jgi:type I restriction-modification system DNA methylase subunit